MVDKKLSRDDSRPIAGLALKLTPAEYERLRGSWVAVDDSGAVKLTGTTFEEVDRAAMKAGLSSSAIEFVFIPKHELVA